MDRMMKLNDSVFETTLYNEDYCVRDHRVYNTRILPGVFLLDLIYRMVETKGIAVSEVELRRIVFYEPIATSQEHDREIQIILESKDKYWNVSVQSRKLKNNELIDEHWSRNCTAELYLVKPTELPRLTNISNLLMDTPKRDIDELYAYARSLNIDHYDFMKVQGTLHRGPEYLLANARLSSLANQYLVNFCAHPAFLDFSTLLPFNILQHQGKEVGNQPFIPIFIERFRIYGSPDTETLLYIRDDDVNHISSEMLKASFKLYSPNGDLLVSFEGFSAKRIRQGELIERLIVEVDPESIKTNNSLPLEYQENLEKNIDSNEEKNISGVEGIEEVLCSLVSSRLERETYLLDPNKPFYEFGLESVDLLSLVSDIEKLVGTELYPTLLFEYTTISELANYLSEQFGDEFYKSLTVEAELEVEGSKIQCRSESVTLKEREISAEHKDYPEDAIAIIGLSGRYPMAGDLDEFWENLKKGKDCITEVPSSRWDKDQYYSPKKGETGKTYSRWGGYIDGHSHFDSLFFNISPHEAQMMDPHERLFMETVGATLEDAGYTRERLQEVAKSAGKGASVGVFAGVMWSDYQLFGWESSLRGTPAVAGSWFSSVANRVSYFFNFNGPSMPIDTACSSSLYALHLACESIRRGECQMAVAGGVNLSLHPYKYLKLSELQMLSSSGRCHTFGAQADGYVPGEGVGAVLLKPLSKAIEDKDNIHGVIRGSSVNHNGRTSGYSVPSPDGQSKLIKDALKTADVSPRSITLIEAHGTGTALGDPIEISGLTTAFKSDNTDQGFCSIGSVKSNIGHLESAAGIAGLTKVLLCMKHETFVPSLHSSELNPKLDLGKTPFYVQQETAPWKRPVVIENGIEKEIPRRAGISSFGAGGTNVHIIVEEFDQDIITRPEQYRSEILILSAKNEERLKVYAQRLKEHLEKKEELNLQDVAYTLQLGREAMEARLAIVASNTQEVCLAIESYLEEKDASVFFAKGLCRVNNSKKYSAERSELAIEDLHQIAEQWVKGAKVNWKKLFRERIAQIISLPTYPYEPKHCWIKENEIKTESQSSQLHSLLDKNISNFEDVQFIKRYSPDAFYLADHHVNGECILPGVVSLEMARTAASQISEHPVRRLKSIVWLVPISAQEAEKGVNVKLESHQDDARFIIETDRGKDRMVHVKGKIEWLNSEEKIYEVYDLKNLFNKCSQHISQFELYSKLEQRGMVYGPRMQALREGWIGEEKAVARLALPNKLNKEDYILHPSIMDGALQSVIMLMGATETSEKRFLPFGVDEVTIFSPVEGDCFVYIEQKKSSNRNEQRFDMHLLDTEGRVLVRLQGFTVRQVDLSMSKQSEHGDDLLFYKPFWTMRHLENTTNTKPLKGPVLVITSERSRYMDIKEVLYDSGVTPIWVRHGETYHELNDREYKINTECLEDYEQLLKHLKDRNISITNILVFLDRNAFFEANLSKYVNQEIASSEARSLFLLAKSLMQKNLNQEVKISYFYESNIEQPHIAALTGMARTLKLENPRIQCRIIRMEERPLHSKSWTDIIINELAVGDEGDVLYNTSGRLARTYTALDLNSNLELNLKKQGVYLITGGAGSLAQIFAKDLAKRVGAKLVLLGRSPLSIKRQEEIREIEISGGEVLYLQADVSDITSVKKAVHQAVERFGTIDGVIHSAGIIEDALTVNKQQNSFERVWDTKVNGVLNIDEATSEFPLGFFISFSSISSVMGSIGQSDYAAANQFLDSFSELRNRWCETGKRSGKTLSINWPLWRDGGMSIDSRVEKIILQNAGLRPLETKEGIDIFNQLLSSSLSQVIVIKGEKEKIEKRIQDGTGILLEEKIKFTQQPDKSFQTGMSKAALEGIEKTIGTIWSDLLQVPYEELDSESDIMNYGVDSIMVMRFMERLEEKVNVGLDPSFISEYPSIQSLANYLLENNLIEIKHEKQIINEETSGTNQKLQTFKEDQSLEQNNLSRKEEEDLESKDNRIAVIGMAARFPGSSSLQEFWENLRDGKDFVSLVPKDRWDIEAFYSPKREVPGHTYCKTGSFIDDVAMFDADFFGISDEDALWMDPQQRLVLELTQELLDYSGYTRGDIKGTRTGVFIGASSNGYVQSQNKYLNSHSKNLLVNTLQNMIAARVSDFYDLHGPSKTIDTACSSSLLALHEACKSLQAGESEMAIAGGVALLLDPFVHISLSQVQVLSQDGVNRVLDRKANGFTLGEGLGAVMLKRMDAAVRDGDQILAVIRGTAVNNDGKTPGLTMPNKKAQSNVIKEALSNSGVDADSIGYLEIHGSGNKIGDPIEVLAATEAYREHTNKRQYCGIGAVKSNFGNMLHAGGIAAFIKVVLSLMHKEIPPTIHCQKPEPKLNLEESPFYPVLSSCKWEPIEGIRRSGISSFGFGGTNCHMIVEEPDESQKISKKRRPLKKTEFKRKHYWLGPVTVNSPEVGHLKEEDLSLNPHGVQTKEEKLQNSAKLDKEQEENLNDRLQNFIASSIGELIGVPATEIDHKESFIDLGVSSVNLIQLAEKIGKGWSIDLHPTILFDFLSVQALADYIENEYADQFMESCMQSEELEERVEQEQILSSQETEKSVFNDKKNNHHNEPIAVIGMSGMIGGTSNLKEFWKALSEGKDLIRKIPKERWHFWGNQAEFQEKFSSYRGSFIDGIDQFDSHFFQISPREVESMDPQVRLFLQSIYAAAEDAAVVKNIRGSKTGIFVGASFRGYEQEMIRQGTKVGPYDGTGNATTMIANRASYYFDLKGPSLTVDTACSSSLVGLHLACQSLRRGECEMAFAGGVNLILSPRHFEYLSEMNAFSTSGRCYSFDERADGYVPGESIVSILLKPLSKAVSDGDRIYAVIEGSAVGHGGHTNSLTAPSPSEQSEVIKDAWNNAGINPANINYVEAHGTGTKLGDPIEVEGLNMAFREYTDKEQFCVLGTTKAYIGHTEAAAGLTGIIRTILSIQAGEIPAMPNFQNLNPLIRLGGSPMYINQETQEWPKKEGQTRRAVVSSFGIGGTNGHVVLKEHQTLENPINNKESSYYIFPISAKTPDRLKEAVFQLSQQIPEMEEVDLLRVAYTLQAGREEMEYRLAIVAGTTAELEEKMEAYLSGNHEEAEGVFIGHEELVKDFTHTLDPFELASIWVKGGKVQWPTEKVFPKPLPVSLPTYPFEKESYWFIDNNEQVVELSQRNARLESNLDENVIVENYQESDMDSELTYFTPDWEKSDTINESSDRKETCIAIVPSSTDIRMIQRGAKEVIIATPGSELREIEKNHFTFRPHQIEDYEGLLDLIQRKGHTVSKVIFIGEAKEKDKLTSSVSMSKGWHGVYVSMIHAIAYHEKFAMKELTVHYIFSRTNYASSNYDWALAGLAKSVACEMPWLRLSMIEVEQTNYDLIELIQTGLNEELKVSHINEIRYSGRERQVRRLVNVPDSIETGNSPLSKNRVVLITGGISGLGLIMAKNLAEYSQARLILTGRRPMDEKIYKTLYELNALGGDAVYLQADVASENQMKACLAYTRNYFGSVEGIIHAAGVIGANKYITELDFNEIKQIGLAKTKGTEVLDSVFCDEPLRFFILFSSLSSVLRTAGQSAYARANRFLDSFAESREKRRHNGLCQGKTVSINFPYWHDGGMKMSSEQEKMIVSATGIEALPSDKGIEAVWKSLALAERYHLSQVAVAHGKRTLVEQTMLETAGSPKRSTIVADSAQPYSENQMKTSFNQTEEPELKQYLIDGLSQMIISLLRLRTDQIKPEEDLAKLGLESLTMAELSKLIHSRFNITVNPPVFYEYRNLKNLAAYLLNKYSEQIKNSFPSFKNKQVDQSSSSQLNNNDHLNESTHLKQLENLQIVSEDEYMHSMPIAVVGMNGTFPGSAELNDFWKNIEGEKDLLSKLPRERFSKEFEVMKEEAIAANRGGFIDHIDQFDPLFFGLSPYEAEMMDPQQRLFLQTVWKTIEDAGYRAADFSGKNVGVFVGVSNIDYSHVLQAAQKGEEAHVVTGLSHAVLPNRVSYFLDIHGPSEPVDTGCSSSLVAIHRAVKAIQNGECESAIAGGVNLLLSLKPFVACTNAGMLSTDGRCNTFDQNANGYVRGEGVGAILLKPLDQAITDGDHIYGVIKGTAVNHGGRAMQGLTAPNPNAQAACLTNAYKNAGIDPATITYIEAHGTGTELGDPIEINGLKQAFENSPLSQVMPSGYCGIGTVKSNIGHLEAAAGIAGLIKVLLAMKYKKLPASLNLNNLNPYIELENSPFYIVNKTQEWAQIALPDGQSIPRRAGVSSFGFGGVNAHIVLEEYVTGSDGVEKEDASFHLLPLSAKSEEQLQEVAVQLKRYLNESVISGNVSPLGDIAFTLQTGRQHMEHRLVLGIESIKDAISKLSTFLNGTREASGVVYGKESNQSQLLSVITNSQTGESFIENLVKEGKFMELARLWTEGIDLPWLVFHRREKRNRIPLPTYPFAKRHCWIDSSLVNDSVSKQENEFEEIVLGEELKKIEDEILSLEKIGIRVLLSEFQKDGVFLKSGGIYTMENLLSQMGIVPHYKQLFKALLTMLTREGYLSKKGSQIKTTYKVEEPLDNEKEKMKELAPDVKGHIMLTTRCLESIMSVLKGEQDGLDVLFPNGDFSLVEDIYKNNKLSDFYNCIIVESIFKIVQNQPTDTKVPKIRILEIGAGTGGTSSSLLERLSRFKDDIEYFYTDISPAFVVQGKNNFEDLLPNMLFKTLDIEKDPQKQGFEMESFDIVFATNVLHATKDLNHTLKRVNSLLKTDGCLLINELTKNSDFATLTFGLTKGWWSFKDEDRLLENSPILSVNQWRKKMEETGFSSVQNFGRPGVSQELMQQAVFLCKKENREIISTYESDLEAAKELSEKHSISERSLSSEKEKRAVLFSSEDPLTYAKDYLVDILLEVLRLSRAEINDNSTFVMLGIDSLTGVKVVQRMEQDFGKLPKTLFIEYLTISDLAKFLSNKYKDVFFKMNFSQVKTKLEESQRNKDLKEENNEFTIPNSKKNQVEKQNLLNTDLLHETKNQNSEEKQFEEYNENDIAIIGMGGIFPGSQTLDEYWQNLENCKDLITEIPPDRFDWQSVYGDSEREEDKTNSKWGGFVDNIDMFDPRYFRITPAEAELMDPQQRLFLKVVWDALQDAGYRPSSLVGSNTGVFVGVSAFDYNEVLQQTGRQNEAYASTGISHAVLANRVSYLLDLHGPSEPVDTACSSSLVAVHKAVRAIQTGDCDAALVGGVNALLTPQLYISFAQAGFMSPNGRCTPFDHRANGYVRGEGAGAIMLKRVSQAIADGDHIYGVIRGTGVNHGGRVKSLTVPNANAQAALIKKVYNEAGIDPTSVTYIETHGTGTPLGDPLEINGLKRAFESLVNNPNQLQNHTCYIGAVKANIGHLEAAAGIAGLIKVLLSMKNRSLAGVVHFEKLNPYIDLEGSPFKILAETCQWDRKIDEEGKTLPRRAGISSFGFGGSNAHLLIEEFDQTKAADQSELMVDKPELIIFSAQDEKTLRQTIHLFRNWLDLKKDRQKPKLQDVAYTLQVGREGMPVRIALLVRNCTELAKCLDTYLSGGHTPELFEKNISTHEIKSISVEEICNQLVTGKEDKVAQIWVNGADIQWEGCYENQKRQRVSLPTHPFVQERYWPEPVKQLGEQVEDEKELSELLYGLQRGDYSIEEVSQFLSD